MALTATLDGAFSTGGFTITGAGSAIGGPMDGFRPGVPGVDLSGFAGITGRIGDLDLGSLSRIAQRLADQGGSGLTTLPASAELLAPLDRLIGQFERLGGTDVSGLLTRVRSAGDGVGAASGLDGVLTGVSAIGGLRDDATVGTALDLVRLVAPGADASALGVVGRHGAAALALVRLFGGLMAIHSEAQRMSETAAAVAGLVDGEQLVSRRDRLAAWAGNRDLAGRIAAADPTDAVSAEALAKEIGRYVADAQAFARALERGLGFGEAALLQADLPARATAMDAAARVLTTTGQDPIRASAEELSAWIDQRFPADFGDAVPGVADALAGVQGLMAKAAAAIDGIDADAITRPVTGAISTVVGVVHQINQVLDTVVGGIRAAFEAVRRLVATLDLRPVAEAIQTALAPVVDAIEALDQLLSEALAGIQAAMTVITTGITDLKTAILGGAQGIKGAFDRLGSAMAAIPLDSVLGDLRGGVESIADTLRGIRLEPYFQTAADVSNTAADVISQVPLGMLPEDAKRDLDQAVEKIQAVDFETQVRQVLAQAMDQILTELDDEVLKDIQALYQQLMTFLTGLDPRGHIAEWEQTNFQPLIDHLVAIDPDTVLKPVADAIASVQDQLRQLEVRDQVLGAVTRVFDGILARFDEFNPATLIAPVVDRVAVARQAVIDATGIDRWVDQVDALSGKLMTALEAIDPTKLLSRLQGAYDAFVASLRSDGEGSLIGSIVAALLQEAMPVRPSSWRAVGGWIAGGDGPATMHALLDPALARLTATRELLAGIDAGATAGGVMTFHRSLAAAVAALPGTSRLRLRVEPLLVISPRELLAGAIANRPRYDAALTAAIAALARKQGSGFSEITTAASGLRIALRPLSLVGDRLQALARRFGIDLAGKDAATIFSEILAVLSPASIAALVQPVVGALKAKVSSIVQDALITPIKAGITELTEFIAHIDLTVLRDELATLHAHIRAQIEAVSPAVLLGPVIDAFDTVRLHLIDYDPLAPIRAVVDGFKLAVQQLAAADSPVRPTVMLAGVVTAYEQVLAVAGALDVQALVAPVLDGLRDLEGQLDDGLGVADDAFVHLQQALAQATGTTAGATVSVGTT